MAHGNPRINICYDCSKYTLVSRFSEDPICPYCKNITFQITKDKIKDFYMISFFYEWRLNFNQWIDISELKK